MIVYYSDDFVAMAYHIDATQKVGWLAESLRRNPIPGVVIEAPEPATIEMLTAVHDPGYVETVRTGHPRKLAESGSFPWDEGTWVAARAECGGAVAAVKAALVDGVSGTLSTGFHHATRERGRFHCTFNGVALAGLTAVECGAGRFLVIDLDAHCGGGTYSLLKHVEGFRQLDISQFETDHYRPDPPSTLDVVASAEEYLPTIRRRLDELDSVAGQFQFCFYFAGMDPHEGAAFGGLPGIDNSMLREREEMVFSWCARHRLPVAFALGGGYLGPGLDRDGLVELHRLTVAAAAKCFGQS